MIFGFNFGPIDSFHGGGAGDCSGSLWPRIYHLYTIDSMIGLYTILAVSITARITERVSGWYVYVYYGYGYGLDELTADGAEG